MENIVITINRQYGSGGKTIGMVLAEKLGVHFYNQEIVKIASEESGIDEALFAKVDECKESNNIFKPKNIYSGKVLTPDSDDYTSTDNLFNLQANVIKNLAEKESCVIVGRCANFILKDYPNVISVFVHADDEFCKSRAMERVSISEKEIGKYIDKINKKRADYYKYYTGHEWFDLRAYDLCIDSGKLGFDKSVEEIISYMNIRF